MASLQASGAFCASISSSSTRRRGRASIKMLDLRRSCLSIPNLTTKVLVEELKKRSNTSTSATATQLGESIQLNSSTNHYRSTTTTQFNNSTRLDSTNPYPRSITQNDTCSRNDAGGYDPMSVAKLYAIMEAAADRAEMHRNIGEQRNNWNTLLLTSINTITLAAATMAGVAASGGGGPIALKLSSATLYLAATGFLLVMNRVQPSQLAEEQRNAARLFRQLYEEINTKISIGTACKAEDVEEAMNKVLALDKAYPLPLLGAMIEKFPATTEPAVWWAPPRQKDKGKREKENVLEPTTRWASPQQKREEVNGWDERLEEEMREIARVVRRNDKEEYLRLGQKALELNKFLAICGPLLTGLAAVGSAFIGIDPSRQSWAAVLGVVGGALASVVNTIEHGGQVGMVFEMYRGNAGFFGLMEECIEANLEERESGRRENGELLEMKVAIQLGRSLSEMRDLAASSSVKGEALKEFASKLF